MKRMFVLLIISLLLVANTGCGKDPRIDKFAVVSEQCHAYKNPSFYYKAKSFENIKAMQGLDSLNKSNNVIWIYKGYTVYVTHERNSLVRIKVILPQMDLTQSWWIPRKDLFIKKNFYAGFWDLLVRK